MKVNKTAIICMAVYAVITIVRIINHIPFFDEAHAWTMAEQLNFTDLLLEVKNEGHFFIWQTLLYPFAHSHLIPYPYPMQALNWIFCTFALILMWWKAPFNNRVKALITFSFPFLGCYGVLARCYSIGILLLFILAVLYDKKTQYPKTYALLLIICANTSVMAAIGASAFGLLFLYDLIKNRPLDKQNEIIVYSILALGVAAVLFQLCNMNYFSEIASNRRPHVSVKLFRNTFVTNNLGINLLLIFVFALPIFKYLFMHKQALFFYLYVSSILVYFLTCVYGGSFWHSYFFYIYLIIAFWISDIHIHPCKIKQFAYYTFCIISVILIFHKPVHKDYFPVYGPLRTWKFMDILENDKHLKYAQIIQNDGLLYEVLPYAYGKTYRVRTHCNSANNNDYSLLLGYENTCAVKRTIEQAKRYPDVIKAIVDDNTYTYIDLRDYNTDKTLYVVPANGYAIYFKKYKCYDIYCFWKVEVKNEK